MVAAASTRWLSIFYSLERQWQQYPVLLLFFKCAGRDGEHIYNALRDIETSVSLVTLMPLLSQLNSLIKTTQLRDISLHDLSDAVDKCRCAGACCCDSHEVYCCEQG
jgi:hypothetical protein